MRKKSTKAEKIMTSTVPNVKPIPDNVAHLVNEGDKAYCVPGDGSCAPSPASAFLFRDEIFGRKLKQKMNEFMAKYWDKKI